MTTRAGAVTVIVRAGPSGSSGLGRQLECVGDCKFQLRSSTGRAAGKYVCVTRAG
jgi:hypothetical protein